MGHESATPLRAGSRVHVIGAGPVGLLLTAMLQSTEGCSVRLYEKRSDYTRTRMVRLAPYLVADTLESYRTDHIDGENIEALFDLPELEEGLAFRRSMPSDLMSLLREWTQGFCPLSTIERSLSDLIDARGSDAVERVSTALTAQDAMGMLEPGDILVDCTGSRSLLRDHLEPYSGAAVEGANTAQLPARIRDRRHLPVRRPLRLQRDLQVLQERREPERTSSSPRSTGPATTATSAT